MRDLLIIGAGPTGLFLAYLLKRRGLDVRIIDKADGPSIHSKAAAVHSRTLEILEKEGLVADFLSAGFRLDGVQFLKGHHDFTIDFTDSGLSYPFVLALPQTETERLLIEALKKLGVEVERHTEVTSYEGGYPIVNGQKIEAKYILACDGAHSITRKSHRFTFLGKPLNDQVLLADVDAKTPLNPHYLQPILHKKKAGFVLPFSEKRYRIMFAHRQEHDYQESDLPRLLEEYNFPRSFQIEKVHWFNNFKLSERMVNTFRDGHIFVLGDAAHVHSPFGGQGMNTCMHDVYNLAWKLELVLKGKASDQLLDSFVEERIPVVRQMLRFTTTLTRLIANERVPLSLFFNLAHLTTKSQAIRKQIVKMLSMTEVSYPKSSITVDDGAWKAPVLGSRMPNIPLADGTSLFDHLKGTKHVLIHFNPNKQLQNTEFMDVLLITGEEARKKLAAKTESFFLIRPDGHIGCRSQEGHYALINDYLDRLHYCVDREGIMVNVRGS